MAGIKIETPRGVLYTTASKNGKMTAKLEWNQGFGPQATASFNKAQAYVDSEVLRLDAPYMPRNTGFMIQSGTLGTVIGSGEVNYIAPYSAKQYDTITSRSYDAQRGGQWIDRMKIDHKDGILRGAKRVAGSK